MFRKRHTSSPHFRLPAPFNPVVGDHVPMREIHWYFLGKVNSGGISSFDAPDIGTGEVSLQILKPGDTELTATEKDVTVYTLGGSIDEDEYVLLQKDDYERYWIVETSGIKKAFCWFTLDGDLGTDEESESATIETQWGSGTDHDEAETITVMNLPTHATGVYEFYGDAGDWGVASYSGTGVVWHIITIECP